MDTLTVAYSVSICLFSIFVTFILSISDKCDDHNAMIVVVLTIRWRQWQQS